MLQTVWVDPYVHCYDPDLKMVEWHINLRPIGMKMNNVKVETYGKYLEENYSEEITKMRDYKFGEREVCKAGGDFKIPENYYKFREKEDICLKHISSEDMSYRTKFDKCPSFVQGISCKAKLVERYAHQSGDYRELVRMEKASRDYNNKKSKNIN